jgi:hypothetical protein
LALAVGADQIAQLDTWRRAMHMRAICTGPGRGKRLGRPSWGRTSRPARAVVLEELRPLLRPGVACDSAGALDWMEATLILLLR